VFKLSDINNIIFVYSKKTWLESVWLVYPIKPAPSRDKACLPFRLLLCCLTLW